MDVRAVRWLVVHFSSGNSDSGPPLMALTFMGITCRLMIITDENAQLMVVTMLKQNVLWLRICSIKWCYCALYISFGFHEND